MINNPTNSPFNGPIEIGLRALTVLTDAFPAIYSFQRLIVFDYLVVHSDDLPDGPPGLHPQTPHRSGELLVRRGVLHDGLMLLQSRGLVKRHYVSDGVHFSATDYSANFLDALTSDYSLSLRKRSAWLVEQFGAFTDQRLADLVEEHIGEWGAEFVLESVLWEEAEA